jgi:hypothetical protein
MASRVFRDFCTYKKTAPMSVLGQNRKYSRRADVFRFTPESGLRSDIAPCPKSAKRTLVLIRDKKVRG